MLEYKITHNDIQQMPKPDKIPKTFVFGAYGTNNVGDEAIFEGICKEYGKVIQIYINKATAAPAVSYVSAKSENIFKKGDRLIFGGGGLIFGKAQVQNMISIARNALTAGADVSAAGVGCEDVRENFQADAKEFLQLMRSNLSVRSEISRQIVKDISGMNAEVRRDFAFNLLPRLPATTEAIDPNEIRIGLVTGGDLQLPDLKDVLHLIRSALVKYPQVKFVHVPHSRAYVDFRNNDLIVGEFLWSGLHLYHGDWGSRFTLAPFSDRPEIALDLYSTFDGVLSYRYHGCIFGKINSLPVLCLSGDRLKARSFHEEYRDSDTVVSLSGDDLPTAFDELMENVDKRRSRIAKLGADTVPFANMVLEASRASLANDTFMKQEYLRHVTRLPIPSFAQFSSALHQLGRSPKEIETANNILKEVIANAPFNEGWYISRYPDVALALKEGRLKNPKIHYIEFGYFEGRGSG